MTGVRTIAEYAIRKWLKEEGFIMSSFSLKIDRGVATLTDSNGDELTLIYDPVEKSVCIGEDE